MGDVLVTFSLSSEWRCALKHDILIKLFYQNMKEYSLQNLMQQNKQKKISKKFVIGLIVLNNQRYKKYAQPFFHY